MLHLQFFCLSVGSGLNIEVVLFGVVGRVGDGTDDVAIGAVAVVTVEVVADVGTEEDISANQVIRWGWRFYSSGAGSASGSG